MKEKLAKVVNCLGHKRSEVLEGDLFRRLVDLAGLLAVRDHAQALAVPHEGGRPGDDVGVNRAGGGLEQRVDQGALPALELPHHRHRHRALLHHGPDPRQAFREVGPLAGTGQ